MKEFQMREAKMWDSFKTELDRLSKLKHKNIVQLIGYRVEATTVSLFMDIYDESLAKVIKNQNKMKQFHWFENQQMHKFFTDILEGLEYIHMMKIAHLDLKVNYQNDNERTKSF